MKKELNPVELEFLLRFPSKAGALSPVDFLQHQGWGGIKVGCVPSLPPSPWGSRWGRLQGGHSAKRGGGRTPEEGPGCRGLPAGSQETLLSCLNPAVLTTRTQPCLHPAG